MAIDHAKHVTDPATGFAVNKDTGARLGIDADPHLPVNPDLGWPRWVVPHASHVVVRKSDDPKVPDHIATPGWPTHHVDRVSGAVTVLVADKDEEKRARSGRASRKAKSAHPKKKRSR